MRIVYNITSHFTSYTRSRQHSNLNKSTGKNTLIWISESHYNDGDSGDSEKKRKNIYFLDIQIYFIDEFQSINDELFI